MKTSLPKEKFAFPSSRWRGHDLWTCDRIYSWKRKSSTNRFRLFIWGCTDKTSQDKTSQDKKSSDICSQGQNVPRDKMSQGQNVPGTKCPKGQNVPRDKTSKVKKEFYTSISSFSKTDCVCIFWKWATYVSNYYFGQVRLGLSFILAILD